MKNTSNYSFLSKVMNQVKRVHIVSHKKAKEPGLIYVYLDQRRKTILVMYSNCVLDIDLIKRVHKMIPFYALHGFVHDDELFTFFRVSLRER